MRQSGMTLIEMLVGFVFVAVIFLIAAPIMFGGAPSNGNVTWGINGTTESRCIEGYRFVLDQKGNARQILDEFGKGVKCENPNLGKPGAFGKY